MAVLQLVGPTHGGGATWAWLVLGRRQRAPLTSGLLALGSSLFPSVYWPHKSTAAHLGSSGRCFPVRCPLEVSVFSSAHGVGCTLPSRFGLVAAPGLVEDRDFTLHDDGQAKQNWAIAARVPGDHDQGQAVTRCDLAALSYVAILVDSDDSTGQGDR